MLLAPVETAPQMSIFEERLSKLDDLAYLPSAIEEGEAGEVSAASGKTAPPSAGPASRLTPSPRPVESPTEDQQKTGDFGLGVTATPAHEAANVSWPRPRATLHKSDDGAAVQPGDRQDLLEWMDQFSFGVASKTVPSRW